MAVVIQEMVQSETSGVLFTANPLTGLRSEMVIDATFGLGEALVSGRVEPDHFVLNVKTGKIVELKLGAKQISTRGAAGGGVHSVQEHAGNRRSLSDHEIWQLAELGESVEQEFNTPQDIEWAFAGGRLYLLQARAITSLFPVPRLSYDPLLIWFSFGAAQGLIGPVTTLGQDNIQHLTLGFGKLINTKIQLEKMDVFSLAGERILDKNQ